MTSDSPIDNSQTSGFGRGFQEEIETAAKPLFANLADFTFKAALPTATGGLTEGHKNVLAMQFSNSVGLIKRSQNFELTDTVLGGGAFGQVQRGLQRDLGRKVALKIAKDGVHDEIFIAEALVSGYLNHPNIIPVYSVKRLADNQVAIAMKEINGQNWLELLQSDIRACQANLPAIRNLWHKHLEILVQVCNAMAFAHSKGFVHCDLKPSNVIVGEHGEVYTLDWGCAVDIRSKEELEKDRIRCLPKDLVISGMGTPGYRPVELTDPNLKAICPQTDCYLLGAILHEILFFQRLTEEQWTEGQDIPQLVRVPVDVNKARLVPLELQRICEQATLDNIPSRTESVLIFQSQIKEYLRNSRANELAAIAWHELARLGKQLTFGRDDLLDSAIDPAAVDFERSLQVFENALELETKVSMNSSDDEKSAQTKSKASKETLQIGHQFQSCDAVMQQISQSRQFFEQSLAIWPQNTVAKYGKGFAHLSEVKASLAFEEFDLAASSLEQLPLDFMGVSSLAAKLKEGRRRRRFKRFKVSALVALLLASAVGLIVTLGISNQRAQALNAQKQRYYDQDRFLELKEEIAELSPNYENHLKRMKVWKAKAQQYLEDTKDYEAALVSLRTQSISSNRKPGPALSLKQTSLGILAHIQPIFEKLCIRLHSSKQEEDYPRLRNDLLVFQPAIKPFKPESDLVNDYYNAVASLTPLKPGRVQSDQILKVFDKIVPHSVRLKTWFKKRTAELTIEIDRAKENDVIVTWQYASPKQTELNQQLKTLSLYRTELAEELIPELEQKVKEHQRTALEYQKSMPAWKIAIADIADQQESPQYKGLKLKQVYGLRPLWKNKDSGLWEFLHIGSGVAPRPEDDYKVVADTGIVLVLIPEMLASVGTNYGYDHEHSPFKYVSRYAMSIELWTQSAEIPPYFISKYETTQGQLLKVSEENPTPFNRASLKHPEKLNYPACGMNYYQCEELAWQFDLQLPDRYQWQSAAQAGTKTVFWNGSFWNLELIANVVDSSCENRPGTKIWNDGYPTTSPVGSFAANPYGLFDTIGNVLEFGEISLLSSIDANFVKSRNSSRRELCHLFGGCAASNWQHVRTSRTMLNPRGNRGHYYGSRFVKNIKQHNQATQASD